jgi:hypothetical protein
MRSDYTEGENPHLTGLGRLMLEILDGFQRTAFGCSANVRTVLPVAVLRVQNVDGRQNLM